MDTSEQYVKMCDCPEIQDNRPTDWQEFGYNYARIIQREPGWCEKCQTWSRGKYCTHCRKQTGIKETQFNDDLEYAEGSEHYNIWLPRQDQLQEMIDLIVSGQTGEREVSAAKLHKFNTFQWCGFFQSMEQLWLAFVMHEKHNKVWTGEEWKEKEEQMGYVQVSTCPCCGAPIYNESPWMAVIPPPPIYTCSCAPRQEFATSDSAGEGEDK